MIWRHASRYISCCGYKPCGYLPFIKNSSLIITCTWTFSSLFYTSTLLFLSHLSLYSLFFCFFLSFSYRLSFYFLIFLFFIFLFSFIFSLRFYSLVFSSLLFFFLFRIFLFDCLPAPRLLFASTSTRTLFICSGRKCLATTSKETVYISLPLTTVINTCIWPETESLPRIWKSFNTRPFMLFSLSEAEYVIDPSLFTEKQNHYSK